MPSLIVHENRRRRVGWCRMYTCYAVSACASVMLWSVTHLLRTLAQIVIDHPAGPGQYLSCHKLLQHSRRYVIVPSDLLMHRAFLGAGFLGGQATSMGMMPGEYVASVRCWLEDSSEDGRNPGKSAVAERYRRPQSSPLKVSVPRGRRPHRLKVGHIFKVRRPNYDRFPYIDVPGGANCCVQGWDEIAARLRRAVADRPGCGEDGAGDRMLRGS